MIRTKTTKKLIKELRKRAIVGIEKAVIGGGFKLIAHECTVCGSDWTLQQHECHKTDCILKDTKA